MRVAFVTAELAPHVQVGGLADVSQWLPLALGAAGDDIRVFVPHYDVFDPAGRAITPVTGTLDLGPLGEVTLSVLEGDGVRVYLVEAPRWFDRGKVYDSAGDDHLRFGALTAAAVAGAAALGWVPDVIHANDWHTGLAAWHMAAAGEPWAAIPTVFTIHNLAYQGEFDSSDLGRMGLPDRPDIETVNSMQTGIETAAMVTTVSPGFAREICEPGGGFGLEESLRALDDRLVGILNGIGDEWDPATDTLIAAPYTAPAGKAPNTVALRDRFGLDHPNGVPLLGIVSRIDPQKGFDLLGDTLSPLLDAGRVQLVVLGSGDTRLEAMFDGLAARYPAAVGFDRAFDRPLGHLIEAGSDIFLMPSRFEPSGLNQMYSMKYGTVPIVHRTGGLADSVVPWDGERGTGFVFEEFTTEAFLQALTEALEAFSAPETWERIQRNGMAQDFSWDHRAAAYQAVYRRAVEIGR